ncbi:hypothetical protein ACFQ1L_34530 [Phytohabitans flavus]|nr:hypothetical protein [Phytohabitans flavus]
MKYLYDGGGIYTTFGHGDSWDNSALITRNLVHDMQQPYWAVYTDWGSSWIRVTDNVIYDFVFGSTGGCSAVDLGGAISHIRFSGNYWADNGPLWMCGPVEDLTIDANTELPTDDTQAINACTTDARCAQIAGTAGLQPEFRDILH